MLFLSQTDKKLIDKLAEVGHVRDDLLSMLRSVETTLKEMKQVRDDLTRISVEKTKAFPWLADAIFQYHELCDLKVAELLNRKLRPAPKAAERIRELAAEKREYQRTFRVARNRVRYYEHLFPWLNDLVGEDIDDLIMEITRGSSHVNPDEGEDPVRHYVTAAEYERLSTIDRNQLALDRYWQSTRTRWQLGRDYERYIGYTYEVRGFKVEYQGIVEGLSDLGRDLIATQGKTTLVIQCKYWRAERTIHEKHIFQLFGTTMEFFLKRQKGDADRQLPLFPEQISSTGVRPVFVTSTSLSEKAREFARALNVLVRENVPFDSAYPVIKCNVSRQGSEMIYHLPMDQQYDTTVIEQSRGEFYACTVREAEERGFRRAWRWHGSSNA